MEFQAEAVARSSFFLLPENARQPYTVNGRQSGRESSRNEHCLLEPVTSSTSGKRREESGFPFLFPFFSVCFFTGHLGKTISERGSVNRAERSCETSFGMNWTTNGSYGRNEFV